jgi:hypothetical protein
MVGERHRRGRIGYARLEDGELVTAEPGDGVSRSDILPDAVGDHLQETVADRVPKGGVHLTEPVQIQGEQREPLVWF